MVKAEVITGDCTTVLPTIEAGSVQTCVTSPPYFGLRDYGTAIWEGGNEGCDHAPRAQVDGSKTHTNGGSLRDKPKRECKCGARRVDSQVGLEETPEAYVERLVGIFREVRRVLKDDGTLWLNLGDSYNADGRKGRAHMGAGKNKDYSAWVNKTMEGTKPKDLLGIPWMVAFALRADGWYLRSDIIEEVELYCPCGCGYVLEERIWRHSPDREIIWHKPNPMPESVTDRPTKAHEYIFLLSKSERYYYDAGSIAEPTVYPVGSREDAPKGSFNGKRADSGLHDSFRAIRDTRNKRSVWTVSTKPFPEAHFATFPEQLIEPCILAGSREGDTVLDPFNGAGTTGVVAVKYGRKYLGCELNPEYVEMSERRLAVAEAMALRAQGVAVDVPRFNKRQIETPLFGGIQ